MYMYKHVVYVFILYVCIHRYSYMYILCVYKYIYIYI